MSKLSANLQKGLVGHWTMDDRDTDSGMLRERSASDNHGTIEGGTDTSQTSPIGQAYSFGGNPDYLDLNVSSIDLGLHSVDTFSVNLWVKRYGSGGGFDTPILSAYNRDLVDGWHLLVQNDNEFEAVISSGGGEHTRAVHNSSSEVGRWYMTTAIFDNNTELPDLYVDGVSDFTIEEGADSFPHAETTIKIARQSNPDERYFDCEVSDVRIYDRVLSEPEIEALYNMRSQRNANV